MNTINSHIKEFLQYYCGFSKAPRYAVLLKGAWGSGKTHFIKNFFSTYAEERLNDDSAKCIFISLNGMSKVSEIEDALFQQVHPILSSRGMKIASAFVKGMLRASIKFESDEIFKGSTLTTGLANESLPDLAKKVSKRVLVFDDVERCSIPLKEIFGYINSFVEHDECKAILIAHEGELAEANPEYFSFKEKLIGRTLEVRSEFAAAFEAFLKGADTEKARKLFCDRIEDVRIIFEQSKTNNLRILQQALWDFERFLDIVPSDLLEKNDGMRMLLRFFLAFSFEVRSAAIEEKDIKSFPDVDYSHFFDKSSDRKKSAQEKFWDKYPEINQAENFLSGSLLHDIFVNGRLSNIEIIESLRRHHLFSSPDREPSWRVLWYGLLRSEKEIEKSLIEFKKQFQERYFTEIEEILHVAGISLYLARIGVIKGKVQKNKKEIRKYIDELSASGRLKVREDFSEQHSDLGAYGLSYSEHKTLDFREIFDYLILANKAGLQKSYPEKAKKLMQEMVNNTELYCQRIGHSNTDNGRYLSIPILAYVDPAEFAEKFISLPGNYKLLVLKVFKDRYPYPITQSVLLPEAKWLQKAKIETEKRLKRLPLIHREALQGWINSFIDPVLERFKTENVI